MDAGNSLKAWIYRNRRYAKQWLGAASRVLPAPLSRRLRALAEQVAFRVVPEYQGDTLPEIFHYWSSRHVRPLAERVGMVSAEEMYLAEARKVARRKGRVSIASIGSGAGWLELSLLGKLHEEGLDARMACIDCNAALMRTAEAEAKSRGLGDRLSVAVLDGNRPFALDGVDVLIVNQFFHHVEELEVLVASLSASLDADGVLLTSDVIGRNGHLPWPSVDAIVQEAWRRLPAAQRFDRYYMERRERYAPVDHAAYSNEGVRAQDVVECLLAGFDFERFLAFGGAIMPFVERRIGFNFDPSSAEDAAFIDGLATFDNQRIEAGDYPASNMIAVLRHKGKAIAPVFAPISPEQQVAATRRQLALC